MRSRPGSWPRSRKKPAARCADLYGASSLRERDFFAEGASYAMRHPEVRAVLVNLKGWQRVLCAHPSRLAALAPQDDGRERSDSFFTFNSPASLSN